MKIYLVWAWYADDEPMVIAVADSNKKAEDIINQAKNNENDFDGYEFSIDERVLNEFEF